MYLVKYSAFILLLTACCAVAKHGSLEFGVSNKESIGEEYKLTKIGHSTASRVEIFEVSISDLENHKCLFKSTLKSMTFIFNEFRVLIGSERIHEGNLLSEIQSCLAEEYQAIEFTAEEKEFFGPEAAKYESSTIEVFIFYTDSENTTRYGANFRSNSGSR